MPLALFFSGRFILPFLELALALQEKEGLD
jgi:hypothetical protein